MRYIFFGNNNQIADHLRGIIQKDIAVCSNNLRINNLLSQTISKRNVGIECCIFFERKHTSSDVQIIKQLVQLYPTIYIILISTPLIKEEKLSYLKAGIDCIISENITKEEINKMISFAITYHDKAKANDTKTEYDLTSFKLPLWKRIFDIVASLSAIILLSPVFIATALAIRLESKGPVVYKSKRVGSNFKIFYFFKFRSMYLDADRRLAEYKRLNQYTTKEEANEVPKQEINETIQIPENTDGGIILFADNQSTSEDKYLKTKQSERSNVFFKLENDPRITHVGKFIRKYSIDELPQLFNILLGDMSVVGNRPLPLYEAELLTSDEYIQRFMAPAGLTGIWQVEKRGDAGKMSAEERKQLDIKYAKTFSFLLDIKIIFKTFTAFVQKENV